MSSYSFSDEAIQDLDEICEYIARSNPKAASKLLISMSLLQLLRKRYNNEKLNNNCESAGNTEQTKEEKEQKEETDVQGMDVFIPSNLY